MSAAASLFAAAAFVIASLLGFTAVAAHELWTRARKRRGRWLGLGLGLLAGSFAAVLSMRTLYPGAPMAAGEVSAAGERIPLPPHADGRVIIVATGKVGRAGMKTAHFVLSGTEVPVQGTLDSFHHHVRVKHQRMGVGTASPTVRLQARIPEAADALRLASLQGGLDGPIHVEVYGAPWPGVVLYTLGALGLLAAALLHVHLRLQRYAVALGIVLAVGLFVQGFATPEVSFGFALAALAMAILAGAPVAGALVYAVRKLARVPAPTTRVRRR